MQQRDGAIQNANATESDGDVDMGDRISTSTESANVDLPIYRASAITAKGAQQGAASLARNADSNNANSAVDITNQRSNNTYSVSKRAREVFAAKELSPRIQAMLNQPYGKDNLTQCYKSEACLRLVLLPLWNSNFLDRASDWRALAFACPAAMRLQSMIAEYATVDFRPLQGFQTGWETETTLNTERVRWATAALLHFEGDMAALVRWIGGPHVGAHRDAEAILTYLQGKIDPDTWRDIARGFRHGAPNLCNAEASNKNFEAFREYGNHRPYEENREEVERTLVKDNARGYCLVFDQRVVDFTLNCHLTPCGLVNVEHQRKPTRPIFDSSFRPSPWCMAINDHTHKCNEPPLHFAESFNTVLVWIYNLRLSYPNSDIYPGDDDIKGAFRHIKYHPNVVGLHCYQPLGYLAAATGTTFGDNTSPSNFEPLADGRRQLAQYLWKQADTVALAARYIPDISFAQEPTEAEIAELVPAEWDSIHRGAFEPDGSRRAPPFPHHVDDNLYADVKEHMPRTVSASILALYHVFGFPSPLAPDPLSREKFDGVYTYQRKILGRLIDTRRMEVGITADKKEHMIATLHGWLSCGHYSIKDIASLHGTLEDMTRPIKWARPLFFSLQNTIRHTLHARYHTMKRKYATNGRRDAIARQLPASLQHRLESLIAIDKAKFLWANNIQLAMTTPVRASIGTILTYLTNPAIRWTQPIGYIIDRDPHCDSTGDASELGAGAYSAQLRYWVDIVWSDKVRTGLLQKPNDPGFIHINSLEFTTVLVQLAAVIVRLQSLSDAQYAVMFPRGRPIQPVLLCLTDNTAAMAWAQKVTSTSPQGQQLIGILAELLRTHVIGLNARHIAGIDNDLADFISRPTNLRLSHVARAEQIFQKHAPARTWDFFLPSRSLLRLLSSSLFSGPTSALPVLPKSLGRFVPAGSTISCSPTV